MEASTHHLADNPLAGLISEDIYATLEAHNLLSEKAVRDYRMRQKFVALRRRNISANDAIEKLREEHPYLQFDTVRKIVYRLNRR